MPSEYEYRKREEESFLVAKRLIETVDSVSLWYPRINSNGVVFALLDSTVLPSFEDSKFFYVTEFIEGEHTLTEDKSKITSLKLLMVLLEELNLSLVPATSLSGYQHFKIV